MKTLHWNESELKPKEDKESKVEIGRPNLRSAINKSKNHISSKNEEKIISDLKCSTISEEDTKSSTDDTNLILEQSIHLNVSENNESEKKAAILKKKETNDNNLIQKSKIIKDEATQKEFIKYLCQKFQLKLNSKTKETESVNSKIEIQFKRKLLRIIIGDNYLKQDLFGKNQIVFNYFLDNTLDNDDIAFLICMEKYFKREFNRLKENTKTDSVSIFNSYEQENTQGSFYNNFRMFLNDDDENYVFNDLIKGISKQIEIYSKTYFSNDAINDKVKKIIFKLKDKNNDKKKKENDVFLIATAITNFNESTNNENLWDEFKKVQIQNKYNEISKSDDIVTNSNICNLKINEKMSKEILDNNFKLNFLKIEKSFTNNELNRVFNQNILNSKRKNKNKNKNVSKEKSIKNRSKSKNSAKNEDSISNSMKNINFESPYLNLNEESKFDFSSYQENEFNENERWNRNSNINSSQNLPNFSYFDCENN